MKNAIIATLEKEYIKNDVPDFAPGDDVRVRVKIVEGNNSRIQNYEGVCIARSNAGLGSSFTVRKISYGEGVERVFPLHSPLIDGIEIVRRGRVRRAKLYYLRALRGKAARIVEKTVKTGQVGKKNDKAKSAKSAKVAAENLSKQTDASAQSPATDSGQGTGAES